MIMVENKKTITVTQEVKGLMLNIMNKAYLTGEARNFGNEKTYEQEALDDVLKEPETTES